MLREPEALALVVGAHVAVVEDIRALGHVLVDQPAGDLPVIEGERGLVAAHHEHPARAGAAGARVAEAGIEEAGIGDAELPASDPIVGSRCTADSARCSPSVGSALGSG